MAVAYELIDKSSSKSLEIDRIHCKKSHFFSKNLCHIKSDLSQPKICLLNWLSPSSTTIFQPRCPRSIGVSHLQRNEEATQASWGQSISFISAFRPQNLVCLELNMVIWSLLSESCCRPWLSSLTLIQ